MSLSEAKLIDSTFYKPLNFSIEALIMYSDAKIKKITTSEVEGLIWLLAVSCKSFILLSSFLFSSRIESQSSPFPSNRIFISEIILTQ